MVQDYSYLSNSAGGTVLLVNVGVIAAVGHVNNPVKDAAIHLLPVS